MWRIGLLLLASCTLIPAATADDRSKDYREPPADRPKEDFTPAKPPPIVMPIADKPADPWAGVKGDVPATLDDKVEFGKRWELKDEKIQCTAMRDHCLGAITWFWIHEGENGPVKTAHVVAFTPEGPSSPHYARLHANQDKYQAAYKTVPATKGNLIPGALAVSHDMAVPDSPREAYGYWYLGKIERVDWDLGMVFFEEKRAKPRFITSLRVAVLKYEAGGKVAILGDKKRDQLAVSPKDVVMPDPAP